MKPDLYSAENLVLLNPRMPQQQADRLTSWLQAADHLTAHVFVLTSGSTAASEADYKWVALGKQAVLAAAVGANQHLDSSLNDIWLHTLPDFHVGGLGIWARAELSSASVVKLQEWNPNAFVESIHQNRATLASLVPTQVHDLVSLNLKSPPTLRAIIVGGAALAPALYHQARTLGWPLLCSYGLSEVASQAATAPVASLDQTGDYPAFVPMPHLQIETDPDDRIKIRGESLLTGYIAVNGEGNPELTDPKVDGWLVTADFGKLQDGRLTMTGRESDRLKIGGEIVNLQLLRGVLEEEASRHHLGSKVALFAFPDPRLESVIGLVHETDVDPTDLIKGFNGRVMPFEIIRKVRAVQEIPRTDLGKVRWTALAALVQEQ